MKIANPAQLTNFLWNEKNKFPLTAIKGSIAKGFEVDDTELFPWLMKFQQWLSDFNDAESSGESPTAAGETIPIDYDWLALALADFATTYHVSRSKDLMNDVAEYLDEKLKGKGVYYVLNDSETTAAGDGKEAMPNNDQIQEWKQKAAKWDALDEKIGRFYGDEDGEGEVEGDLGDIGETAAIAFGYL